MFCLNPHVFCSVCPHLTPWIFEKKQKASVGRLTTTSDSWVHQMEEPHPRLLHSHRCAGTRVRSVTKSAAPGALPTAVVVDLESTSATDYSSTSSSQGGTGAEAQDDGSGPASSPSSSGSYRATADVIMWTAGSAPATRAVPRSGFPFPTDTRGSVQTVRMRWPCTCMGCGSSGAANVCKWFDSKHGKESMRAARMGLGRLSASGWGAP